MICHQKRQYRCNFEKKKQKTREKIIKFCEKGENYEIK